MNAAGPMGSGTSTGTTARLPIQLVASPVALVSKSDSRTAVIGQRLAIEAPTPSSARPSW